MASPSDRVYSESHEWHQVSGDTLTLANIGERIASEAYKAYEAYEVTATA